MANEKLQEIEKQLKHFGMGVTYHEMIEPLVKELQERIRELEQEKAASFEIAMLDGGIIEKQERELQEQRRRIAELERGKEVSKPYEQLRKEFDYMQRSGISPTNKEIENLRNARKKADRDYE